jgi:hypothetical protein
MTDTKKEAMRSGGEILLRHRLSYHFLSLSETGKAYLPNPGAVRSNRAGGTLSIPSKRSAISVQQSARQENIRGPVQLLA